MMAFNNVGAVLCAILSVYMIAVERVDLAPICIIGAVLFRLNIIEHKINNR